MLLLQVYNTNNGLYVFVSVHFANKTRTARSQKFYFSELNDNTSTSTYI